MNADRSSLHVEAVRGDLRVPDARQVRRDHRKFLAEQRKDGCPHARGLRVAVQQDQRRAVTTRRVMQLNAVDFCRARDEGFVWCFSIRRGRKRSGKEKQAEHSQDGKQFKNALHGKLLVLRAHYTRIEAVGPQRRTRWVLVGAVARASGLGSRTFCAQTVPPSETGFKKERKGCN